MNKALLLFFTTVIAIISCNAANVEQLMNMMASRQSLTEASVAKILPDSRILLLNNEIPILVSQHSNGGCLIICRSKFKNTQQKNSFTSTNPVSLSKQGKTVFWETASLNAEENPNEIKIILRRKNSKIEDYVIINQSGEGTFANWHFQ